MAETQAEKKAVSADKPPPPPNVDDQALYKELTQDVGQWSGATGVAGPGAAQVAAWEKQYGSSYGGNLQTEAANIGWYYNHMANRPSTSLASIRAAAMKDPRWNEVDFNGQQALLQMYNLQAMGYGGDLGANTPLPPLNSGPGGTTGIGAAPTGGMNSSQKDAWAQLQTTLASYGFTGVDLTQLVAWAKQEIVSGNSPTQIALDLYQTPQFKARFPAIGVLAGQGVAITPAQYISLEQSYAQIEHAAGLPPNFASFDKLIANQVSPAEYSDRVTQGYLAVAKADPTVIQAMKDFYGVSNGQLAAYFLDPTKSTPLLEQQAAAAQIGGAAAQAGFRNQATANAEGITQAQALRMAQMGVTQSQAQAGFKNLSTEAQLYHQLPGAGTVGNPLTNDQLLNAQFGSDGQTQLQLQIQAEFNKGMTAQGTQVGQTTQGATGVGAVTR